MIVENLFMSFYFISYSEQLNFALLIDSASEVSFRVDDLKYTLKDSLKERISFHI